jgi:hypothetical protein
MAMAMAMASLLAPATPLYGLLFPIDPDTSCLLFPIYIFFLPVLSFFEKYFFKKKELNIFKLFFKYF